MGSDSGLDGLYFGDINLWVEDELTRDYLSAIWDDQRIHYLIGGGREGVRAILRDAEVSGFKNVFGVIDRDFGKADLKSWADPAKKFRCFVLPVHEIENYLLVARALHASPYNDSKKTVNAIEKRMAAKSSGLCWWSACRQVIAELKGRFREPFLPDPSQVINDKSKALAHILESEWFKKLANESARSTAKDVQALLTKSHKNAQNWLADERWRQEFSGREILRDVAAWMCATRKLDSEFMSDFAKGIALWQVQNGEVPPDMTKLRDALNLRVAS